jgi:DNA-binding LacI/PurR family transcriptional regulator
MGEQRRVTIKDVARHAGVSPGAVSRVLHGKTSTIRVSEYTADLIRKAAVELDYRPNPVAQSLRSGKTHSIAVASHRDFDFVGEDCQIIHRLIREAGLIGYSVLMNARFFGPQVNSTPLRGNFDALVWLGSPREVVTIEMVNSIRVPFGCINSDPTVWPESAKHWESCMGALPFEDILKDLTLEPIPALV